MEREEFRRAVRKMQDEGVPLTMANLLVRTELPRAQIESWLDEAQRDVRIARPAPVETPERNGGKPVGLARRARALQGEIVADVVKTRLGLREEPVQKRGIKVGGVLGAVLPPLGLAYSAPWVETAIGSVLYLVLAWLAIHLPFGIPYILVPTHLAGGAIGAAYAWRHNRKGKRAKLLPSGK